MPNIEIGVITLKTMAKSQRFRIYFKCILKITIFSEKKNSRMKMQSIMPPNIAPHYGL